MLKKRLFLGLAFLGIFLIGAGTIVYFGRPIMNLETQTPKNDLSIASINTSERTYTMADIQSHNTQENCWSAINGDVYDLTTWVSRHPGGSKAIIKLCGADGSSSFERQHGRSSAAQSALALLKIGTLNENL